MTQYERMVKGLIYNPCKVLRKIGELDREYFYKNEKIDWDNID